jgi:hypothetical protein
LPPKKPGFLSGNVPDGKLEAGLARPAPNYFNETISKSLHNALLSDGTQRAAALFAACPLPSVARALSVG